MGFHTFDAAGADRLEDAASRYRYLSRDELLYALDPGPADVVADIGSGTGFFTDDVAPHVGVVYAIDVQEAMHEYYRDKGVPPNVNLVTAGAGDLPFEDDELDAVVSTMTFHEFADEEALAELARVTSPTARVVIADWTANGDGADGPPLDERFSATDAETLLSTHGFDGLSVVERKETFVVSSIRQEE